MQRRNVAHASGAPSECENTTQEHGRSLEDLEEDEQTCINSLLNLASSFNGHHSTECKATQVTSGDIFVSFSTSITESSQLNTLTGISNFELLTTLEKLVVKFYPGARCTKLTVKDRIILTFMKIKMALKWKVLSFLFKITQSRVRAIFNCYVSYLANILKSQIRWPSQSECEMNMPLCFDSFESVRVILDCTEIPLQKPSCLCCRIRTYSHYKGGQTIKIMVGVSPAGLITFISKCFGGRASDKAIFESSSVINLLSHGDSIVVDKGFLIDNICFQKQVTIIRPHFLRSKSQFSKEEAQTNVLISKARVHVERVNQRIKTFDIFKCPLPWNLVNKIDGIFTIVCAMVNLQTPVLGDNRF